MKKICNWKLEIGNFNSGMTYVELAVVLSIFSVLSSVVMFNHRDFQAKVEVKNLASDVGFKIITAQKAALSGLWAPAALPGWKPAYGLYFDATDQKSFIYFADLDNDTYFDDLPCGGGSECLDQITITTNELISGLEVVYLGNPTPSNLDDLMVTFTRPDSGANLKSTTPIGPGLDYALITISTPRGAPTAQIKLYPSGRIEIN